MTTLPALASANAQFVTPQLLVGGDLDFRSEAAALRQLAELVDAGVTHIVDVRVEWSDEQLVATFAPQVAYLHHGMDDAGQRVPPSWFETGVEFALAAIGTGGVVLTHCHMGINRGPSLGLAVLLALGWDSVEALTAIRRARPVAFMAYADDALRWFHHRAGSTAAELAAERSRLAAWRRANELDVGDVIRLKRIQERRGA
jgi:protein-tyrosine phosphatase